MIQFGDLTPGADGLVAAIVQDDRSGAVLMVGFMNEEAFDATVNTGSVHFWSRSRSELWRKGETSGNTLTLVDLAADCDGDALLVRAIPSGPVCHTGSETCFGDVDPRLGTAVDRLTAIIAERKVDAPAGSYTARLLTDPDLAARKVLEEAGEAAFAAKDLAQGGDRSRLVEETVDEIYHLLVLASTHDIDPGEIAAEIEARMVPEDAT